MTVDDPHHDRGRTAGSDPHDDPDPTPGELAAQRPTGVAKLREPLPDAAGRAAWFAGVDPVLITAADGSVTRVLGALVETYPPGTLVITYDRGGVSVVSPRSWARIGYEDLTHPVLAQHLLGALPVTGGPRDGRWDSHTTVTIYFVGNDAGAVGRRPDDLRGRALHTYRLESAPVTGALRYRHTESVEAGPPARSGVTQVAGTAAVPTRSAAPRTVA